MSAPIYDANGNRVRPMTHLDRLISLLAILCALFWLLFLAAVAFAQNVQLSPGQVLLTSPPAISHDSQRAVYADSSALWSVPLRGGRETILAPLLSRQLFGAVQITPDGQRVVFISDQDTLGKPELYSALIIGGPATRISRDMPATGQVRDFAIGQSQVYYAADAVTNNKLELWLVPFAGGESKRVSHTMTENFDVFEYAVASSQTGERVVYRSGRSDVGGYKLHSAPANGTPSQSKEISRALVTGGAVAEFKISPDGQRVVYRADAIDNGRFDLWSVPIIGGTSTRLDKGDGRSVKGDFTVSAGGVRYSYSASEWWSVSITGGASVQIAPPMPEPVRSPDGKWIVYGVGAGLWSSGPDLEHQLVSCPGQVVTAKFLGKPAYSVSPDSTTVLYVAGALWAGPISGAVCLIFRDGFEGGSTGAWR